MARLRDLLSRRSRHAQGFSLESSRRTATSLSVSWASMASRDRPQRGDGEIREDPLDGSLKGSPPGRLRNAQLGQGAATDATVWMSSRWCVSGTVRRP